ncbi:MAG: MIP/aquaporin family protein [Acidimicrobiales bacterium]
MPEGSSDLAGLARLCLAEMAGTALLVAVGLSFVILDFGRGSPVATVLPSAAARRALTGGLFGATGMTIAFSPVGKVSGAHINPVVSLAFWAEGALPRRTLAAFVVSQCIGAVAGAAPLLLWGQRGASISYGATAPGPHGTGPAFGGELVTTFIMVVVVLAMVAEPRWRAHTPLVFPPLYCLMVWAEAPLSGTSTNPARSLGPDVMALATHAYWLYVVAPAVGALLAVAARRALPVVAGLRIDVAKVAHFEEETVHVLVTRTEAGRPRPVAGTSDRSTEPPPPPPPRGRPGCG